MNQIKNKESCSGYHTSENTVREISQPVKIAQLIGSSGQLQNDQRNSVIKSLPERITPYLKKVSSQKKNVTNMRMKLLHDERNVRRNLKFTEIPVFAMKIQRFAKTGIHTNEDDIPKKKKWPLSTRKSFLLPPNTIKELHIKNRFKRNRSETSQFHVLTVNSENINPKISETSESCSSPVESTNAQADSIPHMKEDKTLIKQSISSQMLNVKEQSGINILHSSSSDLTDTSISMEKIPENLNSKKTLNVNVYRSQNNDCDFITNKFHLASASDTDLRTDADVYSNDVDQNISHAERHSPITCILPGAAKVKEASLIKKVERERCLQCNTNENEYVTVSKTEFIVLASKLKHLICRLEEDVSDLKLILTHITNLLSTTNEEIRDNNEAKIIEQKTESLNDNTKVMDNMDKLLRMAIIDAEHDDNIPKETREMPNISRPSFLEKNDPEMQLLGEINIAFESNKENKEISNSPIIKEYKKFKPEMRRRSARLMAKVLKNSNDSNDSFVNLENELDIVNGKSNTPITTLTNQTPAKNKYQNKKIEGKPMKEYMALKSRISCLLTPNIQRFNPSQSKNNIDCATDDAKISVSNKILTELYNLYEDSL